MRFATPVGTSHSGTIQRWRSTPSSVINSTLLSLAGSRYVNTRRCCDTSFASSSRESKNATKVSNWGHDYVVLRNTNVSCGRHVGYASMNSGSSRSTTTADGLHAPLLTGLMPSTTNKDSDRIPSDAGCLNPRSQTPLNQDASFSTKLLDPQPSKPACLRSMSPVHCRHHREQ